MESAAAPLPCAPPRRAGSRYATLFSTRVPERAAEFFAGLCGPHALRLAAGSEFDMRLLGFEFSAIHVGAIRCGAAAVAEVSDRHGDWVFSCLDRGQVHRDRRGLAFGTGEASVLEPHEAHELHRSPDMDLRNLRVSERDMVQACRALTGLDCGPALGFDCLNQSAALLRSTCRARDFMHARLQDLPSVADVARHCGVGVRALARGFEQHLHTTPLQYMLALRLDRVHADLARHDGDNGALSVTDVALRWGFSNLGAFAARYRQRFGELPSQTLRQG